MTQKFNFLPKNSFDVTRCPARARLVHDSNRVEIKNLNHNHSATVPRRSGGEAQKLKEAMLKKRKTAKEIKNEAT